MAGKLLWGWDATNKVWIPLQVDANGLVKVDMSNINLNDLADVSVAGPADGDIFYYDDAAGLWKAKAPVQGLCKVYPGTAHATVAGRNCTVQHDTLVTDPDSCWQVGDWYGAEGAYVQADADSDAGHLEDDDANFPAAILGSLVKTASNAAGTANTGIYYVSQSNLASDSLDIHKLSGSDFGPSYYYWIQKKHYVAPVTGYYACFFQLQYSAGVEADERYGIYVYVNGVYTIAALYHASIAEMIRLPHNGVLELSAGDIVSMHTFTDAAGNPTVGSGKGNTVMTIYCLKQTA